MDGHGLYQSSVAWNGTYSVKKRGWFDTKFLLCRELDLLTKVQSCHPPDASHPPTCSIPAQPSPPHTHTQITPPHTRTDNSPICKLFTSTWN